MGLQGEKLQEAEITAAGVVGDHVYVVKDVQTGAILDPKSHPYSWGETSALSRLIEFRSELVRLPPAEDGLRLTLPDGGTVEGTAEELGRALGEVLSRHVQVTKYPRIVESRVASGRTLHLLTSASLKTINRFYPSGLFDVRRFRPNIFVESLSEEGFVEEEWLGRAVAIGGSALVRVEKPNIRCVVTTLRQGALPEDKGILESVDRNNGKRLGVMCTVTTGGHVKVGDLLNLV